MKLIISFVAIALLLFSNSSIVLAQRDNTITIEPSRIELELKDSNQVKEFVTITNQYKTDITLSVEVQGIEENTGRIIPVGESDNPIISAIKLSETQITISPQSNYLLEVTATDSEGLPAGGHYGSLVFTNITDEDQDSSIRTLISAGIFLVKEQGKIKNISAISTDFERGLFQMPSLAKISLLNDGNVHNVPRGYLRIYDSHYVYFETIINNNSEVLLPNRVFNQEIPISITGSGFFPKNITIELGYRADGIEEISLYNEKFWYVPKFFIAILGVITTGSILLYYVIKRFHKTGKKQD